MRAETITELPVQAIAGKDTPPLPPTAVATVSCLNHGGLFVCSQKLMLLSVSTQAMIAELPVEAIFGRA